MDNIQISIGADISDALAQLVVLTQNISNAQSLTQTMASNTDIFGGQNFGDLTDSAKSLASEIDLDIAQLQTLANDVQMINNMSMATNNWLKPLSAQALQSVTDVDDLNSAIAANNALIAKGNGMQGIAQQAMPNLFPNATPMEEFRARLSEIAERMQGDIELGNRFINFVSTGFTTASSVLHGFGQGIEDIGNSLSSVGNRARDLGLSFLAISGVISGAFGAATLAAANNDFAVTMLNQSLDRAKANLEAAKQAATGWYTVTAGSAKEISAAQKKLLADQQALSNQQFRDAERMAVYNEERTHTAASIEHAQDMMQIGIDVSTRKIQQQAAALAALSVTTRVFNNGFADTSNVLTLTTDDLVKYAYALENTTRFGHNEIETVETMLLRYAGMTNTTLPQATQATLNLASAMGTDAVSAASRLGEMLQDPAQGLMRLRSMGIVFNQSLDDQIKALAKSGDTAKAVSLILNELDKNFGGVADTAGGTLVGGLTILGNHLNDLVQTVGEFFVPMFQQAVTWLNNFFINIGTIDFSPLINGVTTLVPILGILGVALVTLGTGLGIVGGILSIVGGFIASINPITLAIIAVVGGLAAAFTTHFNEVKQIVQNTYNDIKPIFDSIVGDVKDILNTLFGGASQDVTQQINVKKNVKTMGGPSSPDDPNAFSKAVNFSYTPQQATFLDKFKEVISTQIPIIFSDIKKLFTTALSDITGMTPEQITQEIKNIGYGIQAGLDAAKSLFAPALTGISNLISILTNINWGDVLKGFVMLSGGIIALIAPIVAFGINTIISNLALAFSNLALGLQAIGQGDFFGALTHLGAGIIQLGVAILAFSLMGSGVTLIKTLGSNLAALVVGATLDGLKNLVIYLGVSTGLTGALSGVATAIAGVLTGATSFAALGTALAGLAAVALPILLLAGGIFLIYKALTDFEGLMASFGLTDFVAKLRAGIEGSIVPLFMMFAQAILTLLQAWAILQQVTGAAVDPKVLADINALQAAIAAMGKLANSGIANAVNNAYGFGGQSGTSGDYSNAGGAEQGGTMYGRGVLPKGSMNVSNSNGAQSNNTFHINISGNKSAREIYQEIADIARGKGIKVFNT